MGKKKDIRQRDVRISRDPVSGRLESVVLDDVQRHFERIVAQVDAALLKLSMADQDRLVEKLLVRIAQMKQPEGRDD